MTTDDDQRKLFSLIAYCRENRVAKIKVGEVEIEFSQIAYAAEMPLPNLEETLEQREARLRREAQEEADILFHSARP